MKKQLLLSAALLAALTAGLASPNAFAQSAGAPAVAGAPPLQACRISRGSGENSLMLFLYNAGGTRCQAGSPMTIKVNQLNAFVAEQACDYGKAVTSIKDPSDTWNDRIMCVHSGQILEPDRKGIAGLSLRYGHESADRKIVPLD